MHDTPVNDSDPAKALLDAAHSVTTYIYALGRDMANTPLRDIFRHGRQEMLHDNSLFRLYWNVLHVSFHAFRDTVQATPDHLLAEPYHTAPGVSGHALMGISGLNSQPEFGDIRDFVRELRGKATQEEKRAFVITTLQNEFLPLSLVLLGNYGLNPPLRFPTPGECDQIWQAMAEILRAPQPPVDEASLETVREQFTAAFTARIGLFSENVEAIVERLCFGSTSTLSKPQLIQTLRDIHNILEGKQDEEITLHNARLDAISARLEQAWEALPEEAQAALKPALQSARQHLKGRHMPHSREMQANIDAFIAKYETLPLATERNGPPDINGVNHFLPISLKEAMLYEDFCGHPMSVYVWMRFGNRPEESRDFMAVREHATHLLRERAPEHYGDIDLTHMQIQPARIAALFGNMNFDLARLMADALGGRFGAPEKGKIVHGTLGEAITAAQEALGFTPNPSYTPETAEEWQMLLHAVAYNIRYYKKVLTYREHYDAYLPATEALYDALIALGDRVGDTATEQQAQALLAQNMTTLLAAFLAVDAVREYAPEKNPCTLRGITTLIGFAEGIGKEAENITPAQALAAWQERFMREHTPFSAPEF